MLPLSSKNQNSTRISWNPDFSLKIWCLFSFLSLHRCVRPFQRLTRKGWPPGISRSWNCSAYSPGKLCWTCLCTDRKGEILQAILPLIFHFQGRCHTWWMFIFLVLVLSFIFFSLSLSLPRLQNMLSLLQQLNVKFSLCSLILNNFSFVSLPSSWTYGSNSLPTAGSVSGGVARRGQRQFQMTPRGLPAGRMGLLSPSGIGGASPRHTLTSPALAAQGRQVSIQVSVTFWSVFPEYILLSWIYTVYMFDSVERTVRKLC